MSTKEKMKKMMKAGGFTLIELLIVISLLAALVGLILPRMSADRSAALDMVCDYNQAGTARALSQYAQYYGVLPSGMHAGLAANDEVEDVDGLMPMPETDPVAVTAANFLRDGSVVQLTENQAASLVAGGLTTLAHGEGYNVAATVADMWVGRVTADWEDDEGEPMTFRGRSVAQAEAANNGFGGEGIIIPLFITPTIDWESGYANLNSIAAVADVEFAVDLEGRCPVPEDAFNYYIAFVKAFNDGSAARLIGTACPECGLLNP